jgi:hypothetical protein
MRARPRRGGRRVRAAANARSGRGPAGSDACSRPARVPPRASRTMPWPVRGAVWATDARLASLVLRCARIAASTAASLGRSDWARRTKYARSWLPTRTAMRCADMVNSFTLWVPAATDPSSGAVSRTRTRSPRWGGPRRGSLSRGHAPAAAGRGRRLGDRPVSRSETRRSAREWAAMRPPPLDGIPCWPDHARAAYTGARATDNRVHAPTSAAQPLSPGERRILASDRTRDAAVRGRRLRRHVRRRSQQRSDDRYDEHALAAEHHASHPVVGVLDNCCARRVPRTRERNLIAP